MVKGKRPKINKDFILLWQGHFISGIGDVFYTVALGFFVLQITGSTALMGGVMASSALINVLASPIAGVIADRFSRRNILIITDFGRGGIMLVLAVLAYFSILDVWMLFVAGVILGILDAFFSPAVNAFLPDIVPEENLMRCNAAMSYSEIAQNLVGGPIGGLLYATLGAPVLFLIDGISFVASAISEGFIKTKTSVKGLQGNFKAKIHVIKQDFVSGWQYIKQAQGIRALMIFALFANLFGGMVIMLLLPYFELNAQLGSGKYGIALGAMAVGSVIGLLFSTFAPDIKKNRGVIFSICWIITCFSYGIMMFLDFAYLLVLLMFGTMAVAIFNVMVKTSFQEMTAPHQRGKVFSIIGIFMNGMLPISMVLGGILAEFFPIPIIIAVGCSLNLLLLIYTFFKPQFWLYLRGGKA